MRFELVCHPDTPSCAQGVAVEVVTDGVMLVLTFAVRGAHTVLLPSPVRPVRTDGLWQTTCFEVFVGFDDGRYHEYNFAPSGAWAAYAFDGYRSGMTALDRAPQPFTPPAMTARLPLDPRATTLGLSAVIACRDGSKSYWALVHPPGAPDFHQADTRVIRLDAR